MIAFADDGLPPRPICVRNHDRPMHHRKSPTASKMFIFIQFDVASNARFNVRPKRARNTKLRSTNRRLIRHDATDSSTMSLQTPNFAAEHPRSPRKSGLTIHSTPWRRNPIRLQKPQARSRARDFCRWKRGEARAKTLTVLAESLEPRLCRTGGKRRDDFFAHGGNGAPETGKFQPPSLVWVARFCRVLIFFDARGRVTSQNLLAKIFLLPAWSRRKALFVFFMADGKRAEKKLKTAALWPPSCMTCPGGADQEPSLRTCACRREIFRDAEFLWITPCCAARMISGSAWLRASRAFLPLPAVIASSTARSELRIRVSRILLIAVRRAILRVAFLAEAVFAIATRSLLQPAPVVAGLDPLDKMISRRPKSAATANPIVRAAAHVNDDGNRAGVCR
jgi:hypothetical protein